MTTTTWMAWIKTPLGKGLTGLVLLAIFMLFLQIWGQLVLNALGIEAKSSLDTVTLMIGQGFYLPPLITFIYLITPIVALVLSLIHI